MNRLSARLAALVRQNESTQWQPSDVLAVLQADRLRLLARHLKLHAPQFAKRLREADLTVEQLLAPGGLQRLPTLSRRQLQAADDLYCTDLPPVHGPLYETRTSGSTGEPVVVRRTAVNGLDWMAATLRTHLWHRHDFSQRFCSIRADIPEVVLHRDWGIPVNLLFHSSPLLGIPAITALDRQIDLIRDFKPSVLLVYPSNLAGMLDRGIRLPSVRHVLSVGETLTLQTREVASRFLEATITDTYSSQELGIIAVQCPDSTLYHVQSENLLVEVLNPDESACRVGEVGRVVVTDLRNFATPMIRYDVGDWAQVGPQCSCGRGLPTLSRILGRERNLILMPDGTRHWPLVGFRRFRDIAPVVQYQLIQDGRDQIELRLVVEERLSLQQEGDLAAHVQKSLGFAFKIRFVYFPERIPAGANGKFEEFICRVA